jgi:hypothetical protein
VLCRDAFTRRSIVQKHEAIKQTDDSASLDLTSKAFKRTAGEENFI